LGFKNISADALRSYLDQHEEKEHMQLLAEAIAECPELKE